MISSSVSAATVPDPEVPSTAVITVSLGSAAVPETLITEKQRLTDELLVINRFITALEKAENRRRAGRFIFLLLILGSGAASSYGMYATNQLYLEAVKNAKDLTFITNPATNATHDCYTSIIKEESCEDLASDIALFCLSVCNALIDTSGYESGVVSALTVSAVALLMYAGFFCVNRNISLDNSRSPIYRYPKSAQIAAVNMSQRINTMNANVLSKGVGELYTAAKILKTQKDARIREINMTSPFVTLDDDNDNDAKPTGEAAKQKFLTSSVLMSDSPDLEFERQEDEKAMVVRRPSDPSISKSFLTAKFGKFATSPETPDLNSPEEVVSQVELVKQEEEGAMLSDASTSFGSSSV